MSAAASVKIASADSPIYEVLAERWTPYAFRDKPVSQDELRSLFEAARWAPSSYNEQPWRYVVATRDYRAQFERLLSCLVEGNQAWAKHVPVIATDPPDCGFPSRLSIRLPWARNSGRTCTDANLS
jgi:nitroreductase